MRKVASRMHYQRREDEKNMHLARSLQCPYCYGATAIASHTSDIQVCLVLVKVD